MINNSEKLLFRNGCQMLIHIGYHKTGTTWLQDHIFSNAAKGFVSPWTVFTGEAIEYFVIKNCFKFNPEEARTAFEAACGNTMPLVPVISHEDLNGYPVLARYYGPEVARRLQATFPDARVLIVVREQRSMLLSLYRQYIRQDGEWPIEDFIGDGKEKPGFAPICRPDHLEYHYLINLYRDLFGKANVLVLPFESLVRDSRSFEAQIHEFAGSGGKADAALAPANVGWLGATLALRRQINKFCRKRPQAAGWDQWPLYYRGVYKLCDAVDRVIPRRWHRAFEEPLKKKIADRVKGYYGPSNRELSAVMGINLKDLGYEVA